MNSRRKEPATTIGFLNPTLTPHSPVALLLFANSLQAPDANALERVGSELGDPDFRDEVRQRKGESVAANFKRACPDYIPTRANYEAVVETLAFNALSAADQEGTIDEQVAL